MRSIYFTTENLLKIGKEQKQTTSHQKKLVNADHFEMNTEKGKGTETASNLTNELSKIKTSINKRNFLSLLYQWGYIYYEHTKKIIIKFLKT